MIKTIRLVNFQSHKDTELQFDPGVNVIIGRSDSGKTAVVRALNWVVNNRPSGEAFRSYWGGNTSVELALGDGKGVARRKTKSSNKYALIGVDTEEDLKAIGQSVPDEIKAMVDMDDINIQHQLDSPFLLSNSSAEVARVLNQAASLDSIDHANTNIAGMLRKTRGDLKNEKEQKERLEERLKDFEHLDEMGQDLLAAASIETDLGLITTRKQDLYWITQHLEDTQRELNLLPDTKEDEELVAELLGDFEDLAKKEEAWSIVSKLSRDLTTNWSEVKRCQQRLEELERRREKIIPEVCPLCGQNIPKKKLRSSTQTQS